MSMNRVFNSLPAYFKNDYNRKSMSVSDDVLFEPESFQRIDGQVGSSAGATELELSRDPIIVEPTLERQKYQLSVAAVSGGQRPDRAAFYADVVAHVAANGGSTTDHARLFDGGYFAWVPMFDWDPWVNFHRYFWVGEGDARAQGEYITKDHSGSRTVVHRVDVSGGEPTFTSIDVELSELPFASFTPGSTIGDLREDCVSHGREVYKWNGSSWDPVSFTPVSELPSSTALPVGSLLYVARSSVGYQRPLLFMYSAAVDRWVPVAPIVSIEEPASVQEMALWEDCSGGSSRKIMRRTASGWEQVSWTGAPSSLTGLGPGADGDLVFHSGSPDDDWAANNWWRHYDDLSPADRASLTPESQAVRPILQLWGEMEPAPGDARSGRHDPPKFSVYAHRRSTGDIAPVTQAGFGAAGPTSVELAGGCTVVEYSRGAGADDPVLGFPGSFNEAGEFKFELTLETDDVEVDGEAVDGYRFVMDTRTDRARCVWVKSPTRLEQAQDQDGLWELPRGLTDNPDHSTLSLFTRSEVLDHAAAVLSESEGQPLGSNGHRWSGGASSVTAARVIDPEAPLLKLAALLLDEKFSLPSAARHAAVEYSRFVKRFERRLTEAWGDMSDSGGALSGYTADEAVDAVLTHVLAARSEGGPYWLSGMGEYVDSETGESKPIAVPPSAARVGAVPAHEPWLSGGVLRGHDGRTTTAWGDDRDDVWLTLESRFFESVPSVRRVESSTASAASVGWNYRKLASDRVVEPELTVDAVVDDCFAEPDPIVDGFTVFSRAHAAAATWDLGLSSWTIEQVDAPKYIGDGTSTYYFNGSTLALVESYERPHQREYTQSEADSALRRDFERWAVSRGVDLYVNDQYDPSDELTWNYSAAGVEGHWKGIYRRIYWTYEPHSRPWEVCGFSIEPSWWRTTYVPSSVASDGLPRYASSHPMWSDLMAGGLLMPIELEPWQLPPESFPVPVDNDGELIGPVTAGVVSLDSVPEALRGEPWKFGDFGPAEQQFWSSPEGRFYEALLGFLLKPAKFCEELWSDYYAPVGSGSVEVAGGAFSADYGTLRRPSVAAVALHLQSSDQANVGVNSWVSEKIASEGGDPSGEFADVVRSVRPALAWRCSGFVRQGATELALPNGAPVPDEDVTIMLHGGVPSREEYHSGVAIVRARGGYAIYGYDSGSPEFRVIKSARPRFAGQVELSQEFTYDGSPLVVTEFSLGASESGSLSVLTNGTVVDPRTYITSGSTITMPASTPLGAVVKVALLTAQSTVQTRARTFEAGGKVFTYYPVSSGEEASYPYGHVFPDNQSVVEFLYEHGRFMASRGWDYSTSDGSQPNDWLAVARRFAEWSATGRVDGDLFVDVAGGRKLKLELEHGQAADLEVISNGSYGVVDIARRPIAPSSTSVTRVGGSLTVECGDMEVYGLRVRVREWEHVAALSQSTRFGDVVYDPATSLRHSRLRVRAYRTSEWTGRLEAPGYVIVGGELVPNVEKAARDFTRYYDALDQVDDEEKSSQAWNLYGWRERAHLRNIGASSTASVEYHRGLLTHKGTLAPLKAFLRGTASGPGNTTVSEAWAWLASEFGSVGDSFKGRFTVTEADVRDRLQVVRFTDEESEQDSHIEVLPFDRADPPQETRWVAPPRESNFTFPVDSDGAPIPSRYFYSLALMGADGAQVERFVHWDPAAGLHEPAAYAQLDYVVASDPARYTDGEAGGRSPGLTWGSAQVGRLWLDTSKLTYSSYRSIAGLSDRARDWGKLVHKKVASQEVGQTTLSVTTTGVHEFYQNQVLWVSAKNGRRYVGIVQAVLDTDTAELTVVDPLEPGRLYADVMREVDASELYTTDYEVYEWVAHSGPPDTWPEQEGLPRRSTPYSAFSYVTEERLDGSLRYYFWVRGRRAAAPSKSMPALVVEDRLRNPTGYDVRWFAPMGASELVFNSRGVDASKLDSSLEVSATSWSAESHQEWIKVVEGSRPPTAVREKLLDSLMNQDALGGDVPSQWVFGDELYGTGRGQTVFKDVTAARRVFVDAVNRALSRRACAAEDDFDTTFPPAESGTWWSPAEWRSEDHEGKEFTQVAKDQTDLASFKLPREGDLVRVVNAMVDRVTSVGEEHGLYVRGGSAWVEVGAGSSTAQITDEVLDSRDRTEALLDFLEESEESDVVLACLMEMLAQHDPCRWFFKTSVVNVSHSEEIGQPSYAPRSELSDILSGLSESKPYHVKLGDVRVTGTAQPDEAGASVSESVTQRTSVHVDRLACNLLDERGWDAAGWGEAPYDLPPWDMESLGTASWREVGRVARVSGQTEYVFAGCRPDMAARVVTRDGNDVERVTPSHVIALSGALATVRFANPPPAGLTFALEQSLASASASPALPVNVTSEFSWMTAAEQTHKHALARVTERLTGAGNDRSVSGTTDAFGCGPYDDSSDGGSPGERVKLGAAADSGHLIVTTEDTPAYAGWDARPWSTGAWASAVSRPPTSVYVAFNDRLERARGFTEVRLAVEERAMGPSDEAARAVAAPDERYVVTGVEVDYGSGFESVPSDAFAVSGHVVEFPVVSRAYTSGSVHQHPCRVGSARLKSTPLTEGVDYTLSVDGLTLTLTSTDAAADGPLTIVGRNPAEDGATLRLTYGEHRFLSREARVSGLVENALLRSGDLAHAAWTKTATVTAGYDDGPAAYGAPAAAAARVQDTGGSHQSVSQSISASSRGWVTAVAYVKKPAPGGAAARLEVTFSGGSAPASSHVVVDCAAAEVTSGEGACYDMGDYVRIVTSCVENGSGHTSASVAFYPATNMDGSSTPDATATGEKTVWAVQAHRSRFDGVAYVEAGATALSSLSVVATDFVDSHSTRVSVSGDGSFSVVYPGLVTTSHNLTSVLGPRVGVVLEATEDRTEYYEAPGFDESAEDGDRLIDTTEDGVSTRSSGAWPASAAAISGHAYFANRTLSTHVFDGASWTSKQLADVEPIEYELGAGVAYGSLWVGASRGAFSFSPSSVYAMLGKLPTEVEPSLALWLSSNGGYEVGLNGKVSRWVNAGLGGDFVQSTELNQPILQALTGWDSAEVLFEPSNSEHMSMEDPSGLDAAWDVGESFLCLAAKVNSSVSDMVVIDRSDGADLGWRVSVDSSARLVFERGFDSADGAWATPAASVPVGQTFVACVRYDSADSGEDPEVTIDGVDQVVTELSSPSGLPRDHSGFATTLCGPSDPFDGSIRELIIVSSGASLEAHAEIAGRFRVKWLD